MPRKPSAPSNKLMDPENREQQLVGYAIDLAEKQLKEGTASSSVITHFLKIASSREHIERELLNKQMEVMEAKAQTLNRDRDVKELTEAALNAMKTYTGRGDED